jgi:hypothetical protein
MKKYAFSPILIILIIVFFAFPTIANAAIEVNIDIEPGKCPNPVDVDTAEIVKIAVLGDDSNAFDVQNIDPDWGSSLRLTLVEKYQRSSVDLTPNLVYLCVFGFFCFIVRKSRLPFTYIYYFK